jgi:hypothetical protein
MSIFTYNLPSGSTYVVNGPDNATQAEADYIFYTQVAAGALVGYSAGQTLSSVETKITKFELSRLDRGTAGVDAAAILAIVSNAPIIASTPNLDNTPLDNPITQADVVLAKDGIGPLPVGPLSSIEVQGLQAQLAEQVDQPSDEISIGKGVGKYGFNILQLEQAGYVKPNVGVQFGDDDPIELPNPPNFVETLRSPTVWTGKDGVINLDQLLGNEKLQNKIQTDLMNKGYSALTSAGTIAKTAIPSVTAVTGQVYTQVSGIVGTLQNVTPLSLLTGSSASALVGNLTGVVNSSLSLATNISNLPSLGANAISNLGTGALNSVTSLGNAAINSATATVAAVNKEVGALVQNAGKFGAKVTDLWDKGVGNVTMDSVGKMGKYAVSFVEGKLDSLVAGVQQAAGFTGTINRATVDTAVTKILGNPKIPTPTFSVPSLANAGDSLDIAAAQKFLKSAVNQGTALVNQAQAQVNQVVGQVATAVNQAQGAINQGQQLISSASTTATRAVTTITNASNPFRA